MVGSLAFKGKHFLPKGIFEAGYSRSEDNWSEVTSGQGLKVAKGISSSVGKKKDRRANAFECIGRVQLTNYGKEELNSRPPPW